jgi:hypothetical protein
MGTRLSLSLLLSCLATAQTAPSVPDDLKPYQGPLLAAQSATAAARKSRVDDLLAIESHLRPFLEYAAAQPAAQRAAAIATFGQLAQQLAEARIDQSEGSGPNASGSASAVAQAGVTSFLSIGVDTGAMSQAINGTTATVSGNTDSVTRVLLGREPFPYCAPGQLSCGTSVLKDLALSASFDMSRGGTTSVSASGGTTTPSAGTQTFDLQTAGRQFSGATLKYVFANPQDVRSKAFQQQWTDFYNTNRAQFQKAGASLLQALGPAVDPLLKSPTYDALQSPYELKLLGSLNSGGDLFAVFREYLDALLALARSLSPDFDAQVQSAIRGYMQYFAAVRPLIASVVSKPVFSAEYDYQRPASQPDLHHFSILSTFNPFGPNGSMSVNAAATAYVNAKDAMTYGRWRDIQASLQLERRLGDLVNHPATFSLSGYYQYMLTPGLLKIGSGNLAPGTTIDLGQTAAVALAPKGSIWIAEAKVTLTIKSSGAEIPFAITRANRTDLINAPEVRGHVGLTFDFGKLFAGK